MVFQFTTAVFEKAPKPRKDCAYNGREMAVLNVHKEEYKRQNTLEGRHMVFRTKVCPDIFNYWDELGVDVISDDAASTKMKNLHAWIVNNWRPPQTVKDTDATVRRNRNDVTYDIHLEKVRAEVGKILGVQDIDLGSRQAFNVRTKACKAVYAGLTSQEQQQVQDISMASNNTPNPTEVQQRLYGRHADKRVLQWSRDRLLEMGMMSITFTGHVGADGVMGVRMHDHNPGNLGISAAPFNISNEELCREFGRKLVIYFEGLGGRGQSHDEAVPGSTIPKPHLEVLTTENGYPIVPPLAAPGVPIIQKELARVLRDYLNSHYKLASGRRGNSIPIAHMERNFGMWVEKDYYPAEMQFKDPQNMRKGAIEGWLAHLRQRQTESGPEGAFLLNIYLASENGAKVARPAAYTERADLAGDEVRRARDAERRRARREAAAAEIRLPEASDQIQPDDSLAQDGVQPTVNGAGRFEPPEHADDTLSSMATSQREAPNIQSQEGGQARPNVGENVNTAAANVDRHFRGGGSVAGQVGDTAFTPVIPPSATPSMANRDEDTNTINTGGGSADDGHEDEDSIPSSPPSGRARTSEPENRTVSEISQKVRGRGRAATARKPSTRKKKTNGATTPGGGGVGSATATTAEVSTKGSRKRKAVGEPVNNVQPTKKRMVTRGNALQDARGSLNRPERNAASDKPAGMQTRNSRRRG